MANIKNSIEKHRTEVVIDEIGMPEKAETHKSNIELEQSLYRLIKKSLRPNEFENPIYGAVLHIEAPRLGLSWSDAVGISDPVSEAALTVKHPLRIASVTKTYVAVATLRLYEDKSLDLDARISRHISAEHQDILIHRGYQPDRITIRHLLTHTSGLFDYGDSQEFAFKTETNFTHHWSRTEQLQLAMSAGKAYGQPGEVYRYSDTGYILLGEIIERTTAQSLGLALRQLLNYPSLGLNTTWLEQDEPAPKNSSPRAHQYLGNKDAYEFSPSADSYGGGGLVATTSDVAYFWQALFTNKVFKHPTTLNTMLTTVAATRGGPIYFGTYPQIPGDYRMGIEVENLNGLTVYFHRGFWGSYAGYCPELNATISLSLTQSVSFKEKRALFCNVLNLLNKAIPHSGDQPANNHRHQSLNA